MNWNLLLEIWLYSSIPFTVGNVIRIAMLVEFNRVLCCTPDKDLAITVKQLSTFQAERGLVPPWMLYLFMWVVFPLLSVVDGLFWMLKPYKQVKNLWYVLFWKFKKIQ